MYLVYEKWGIVRNDENYFEGRKVDGSKIGNTQL